MVIGDRSVDTLYTWSEYNLDLVSNKSIRLLLYNPCHQFVASFDLWFSFFSVVRLPLSCSLYFSLLYSLIVKVQQRNQPRSPKWQFQIDMGGGTQIVKLLNNGVSNLMYLYTRNLLFGFSRQQQHCSNVLSLWFAFICTIISVFWHFNGFLAYNLTVGVIHFGTYYLGSTNLMPYPEYPARGNWGYGNNLVDPSKYLFL